MLHIYYGKGKGKTSAALGLLMRAAGHGKRITLMQFLKPAHLATGEDKSIKKLPRVTHIRFNQQHPMFCRTKAQPQHAKRLKQSVDKSMQALAQIVKEKKFDVLICDELLNLVSGGWISERYVTALLQPIKREKEVVITGRGKSRMLLALADYASEITCKKHPFKKGIKARRGIEF